MYEQLYAFRDDPGELRRSLAYDLARFWDANDVLVTRLIQAYRLGSLALVIEILALVALVSDSIF